MVVKKSAIAGQNLHIGPHCHLGGPVVTHAYLTRPIDFRKVVQTIAQWGLHRASECGLLPTQRDLHPPTLRYDMGFWGLRCCKHHPDATSSEFPFNVLPTTQSTVQVTD